MTSVALLFLFMSIFPDSLHVLYEEGDIEGLEALCEEPENLVTDLMCRYRLYPLTENEALLEDIPTSLDDGSATEFALLSGLWGYKTGNASAFQMPRFGMRSNRLMTRAKEKNPLNPLVLLINGQSLLYRPSFIGGDDRQALEQFELLRRVVPNNPEYGVSKIEADMWYWYTLEKLGKSEATSMREELLESDPPPTFRDFIENPPDLDEARS